MSSSFPLPSLGRRLAPVHEIEKLFRRQFLLDERAEGEGVAGVLLRHAFDFIERRAWIMLFEFGKIELQQARHFFQHRLRRKAPSVLHVGYEGRRTFELLRELA